MARHIVTLGYTGGTQTITIPTNYNGGFQFDIRGAEGGVGQEFAPAPALGGRVFGNYSPTIGDVFTITVGGVGGTPPYSTGAGQGLGGYGYHTGGAGDNNSAFDDNSGGGGGSTALVDTTTTVLVAEAGGGGGAGGFAGTNEAAHAGNGGYGGVAPGGGLNANPGGAGGASGAAG
ncbi:MAG: hypothetical protein ACRDXE_01620, partial [Acidimicrobiales bacterium]